MIKVLIPLKYDIDEIDLHGLITTTLGRDVPITTAGRKLIIDDTISASERQAIKTAFLAAVTQLSDIDA